MDARTAPTATDPLRWGFLATGTIARNVARDLALLPEHRIVAVGSRSTGSAEAFAEAHAPGATPHGSYADLVADPEVEVVYVASPHSMHLEHVRMALEAGKHVLCEKPVALREGDAAAMVALAREKDLFFMEAMWTACHPVIRAVLAEVSSGVLGTPRRLRAGLGFVVHAGPESRLVDPALGASAWLDMGIYPLTLATLMLGEPASMAAVADLSEGGVDLDMAVSGRHTSGALSLMSASMTSFCDGGAVLETDTGRVTFDGYFHHPEHAWFHEVDVEASHGDLLVEAAPREIVPAEPVLGQGYCHELVEVARCLAAGARESSLVPHAQTLTIMRMLDEVRAQTGVTFPDDPS
ncbi:Gfo/Idh/MocA family protein [Nocardioides bruguierae]|uniref:Gfo/Idh/MocA family protein n=1 Tax=Nocardioides bruguierae TaxID=2945102 RepID=UPI002020D1BE|nr:Gfo/Idh/MocA family oxidoreductase [Nocardioides bruguierae]MCL8024132.1 Gfo/Idh/MocA family oxidoreductase [Nocardioides bruguierae]